MYSSFFPPLALPKLKVKIPASKIHLPAPQCKIIQKWIELPWLNAGNKKE